MLVLYLELLENLNLMLIQKVILNMFLKNMILLPILELNGKWMLKLFLKNVTLGKYMINFISILLLMKLPVNVLFILIRNNHLILLLILLKELLFILDINQKLFKLIMAKNLHILQKLIKPRTPRHNGKVERSHRNDQQRFYSYLSFYSYDDLLNQMKIYLKRSNNIPMQSLNWLSPLQMRQQIIEKNNIQ